MLVLSRHKNQSIMIGDDISIVVVEIRGDKVRLGIEAPKVVPVHRVEVYDAIKKGVESKSKPEIPDDMSSYPESKEDRDLRTCRK